MSRANGYKPLPWTLTVLAGLFLLLLKAGEEVTCLRGSAVVLQAKAKAAELKEAATVEGGTLADDSNVNGTSSNSAANSTNSTQSQKKSHLTGIPQKDYIFDPNLPRELNGHNLTNYPFYNAVPEDIDFNCDGLHDGFYASVPHKCQVYHHCLFGTRYDFLCANYTAFDQKTFICHFVSEVDCVNSPKYYKRNEALYKAPTPEPPPSTTTARPTPATSTAPPQPPPPPPPPGQSRRLQGPPRNRHRRPYRRRRPVYEYYYDDEYDDSEYYDDEDIIQTPPRRKSNRKQRPQGGAIRDDETDFESQPQQTSTSDMVKPSVRPNSPIAGSVYDRPRVPPKIRRPVPINERDKYDYTQKTSDVAPPPTVETGKDNRNQQTRKPQTADDDDYYYDEYEEEKPKFKKQKQNDYDIGQSGLGDSRRPSNRHRLRLQNRKRPTRYEDDEEDDYELEDRPRSRKGQRYEDYTPRSSKPRGNRGKGYQRDDEAVPAERPGYISGSRSGGTTTSNRKRPHTSEYTRSSGRKHQERRPQYEDEEEDDEYYDDEEEDVEEEKLPRKNHKTQNRHSGRRDDDYTEDSRNGRKQNTKSSSDASRNSSPKSVAPDKPADKSKSAESDYLKPSNKQNEKTSDNPSDYKYRQTSNKNVENHKVGSGSNKNPASEVQKSDSREKYDNDEEYEDDYEDAKPLSPAKSSKENGNERSDNFKQSSLPISRGGSIKEQHFKQDETTSSTSGEDSSRGNNYYKSSTVPPAQEQTNGYSRNPSIYRSRTSTTPTTEDIRSSTSTISPTPQHRFSSTSNYGDDYQDRDFTQNYRYKGDNRNRTVLPTTVSNSYKKLAATTPISIDKSEALLKEDKPYKDSTNKNVDDSSEKSVRESNVDSSEIYGPTRPVVSVGLFRRPLKSTTSNIIETTTLVSDSSPLAPQKPSSAMGYRRIVKPNESDEKVQRKEVIPTGSGGAFRRPSKVTELEKPIPPTGEGSYDDDDDMYQKNSQQASRSGSNQYRKPAKTLENSSLENSYLVKNNEDETKAAQQPPSAPGSNYKRPSAVSRPVVEDYPAEYDETSKGAQFPPSAPGSNYRRPFKATTENSQSGYKVGSTAVPPSGPGGGFRRPIEVPVKNEGSTIINLRSHYGFFNPDRPKQPGNDNLPTGPDSTAYPKLPSKNIVDKPDTLSFSRQPPKNIDITAPGPSAPENTNQNSRNGYRPGDFSNSQNPQTGPNLDIADEEYDVTLNDALQPSTLHPTRSLADYSQTRVKSRGFLSTVSHPTGFSNNRGVSPFLLSTSSSQQYISRVQNIQPQEGQASNIESKNQNKDSQASADEEGYEAVVLAAPQFDSGNIQRWVSQRQSRPTEWYW